MAMGELKFWIRWLLWPEDEPVWAKILVPILAVTALIALVEGLGWVAFGCLFVAMVSDRIAAVNAGGVEGSWSTPMPPDTGKPEAPPNVLLAGIVGSTAYGLDTADSDVDRLGLFAAPTEKLLGLHPVQQSVVSVKPDATFHEAGKFAALALKVNPTITELMWLPDDLYETRTELGDGLIAIRSRFLSQKAVRNAYLGYATQQFRKLENRGDGSFSADTRKRTAKHARHLYRLCTQAIILWQTGRLTVRLPRGDAVLCRKFGDDVAGGDLEAGRRVIGWAEHVCDTSRTPLPESPDESAVEAWLQEVRRVHYMTAVVP